MSLLQAQQQTPRCLSCLWRLTHVETPSLFRPIPIQIRSKKKLPRSTTITVRLLQDVRQYGRKGTILAVAPGQMRNHFYPRSQAAYMTAAEVKQARATDMVAERDTSFGTVKDTTTKLAQREAKYDMRTVTPQRMRELLEIIVPETLEFERVPIVSSAEAPAEVESLIHGSVSAMDILLEIAAQLASKAKEEGFSDAARVVMSANDIEISSRDTVVDGVEGDKIKALGEFDVVIGVKQAEPVRRKVRVVVSKGKSEDAA